ncbi:DDE-type integrase/transposase/recombinase [Streptomyces atroolivaceus]
MAGMTYVRTWSGWAYVAFVLDVYSRMSVGWQVANHMRTELLLDALEMALWRPRIKRDYGLIHHSDRGSRYVSIRYIDRLADIGASASVGSVADSYDNAMAEALNGLRGRTRGDAGPLERRRPGRTGDLPNGSPGTTKNVFTPRSTTFRPPSTRDPSGEARSRPRSPPRPPDSTKLGAAQYEGGSRRAT